MDQRGPIEVVEALSNEQADEVLDLARRLVTVSPHRWNEIVGRLRSLVELQETIAKADYLLPLRDRKTMGKYKA